MIDQVKKPSAVALDVTALETGTFNCESLRRGFNFGSFVAQAAPQGL